MSERKIWKVQEDRILKELFQEKKICKWSQIATIMQVNYGIKGRNGKQCRERYHNHLKCGINKGKWTIEEENKLVELHAIYGNKWALISKAIEGRTENSIKNMLYSRMRKSIRQLNRFTFLNYRRIIKQIKINFIYRLIDFTQNCYAKSENQRTIQQNKALYLKNEILEVQSNDDVELNLNQKEKLKHLILDIHAFKRQNQRYRGNNLTKKGRSKVTCKNNKSQQELQNKLNDQSMSKDIKKTEISNIQCQKNQNQNFQSFDLNSLKTKTSQSSLPNNSETTLLKFPNFQDNSSYIFREPIFLEQPIQLEHQLNQIQTSLNINIGREQPGNNINVWSNYMNFLE